MANHCGNNRCLVEKNVPIEFILPSRSYWESRDRDHKLFMGAAYVCLPFMWRFLAANIRGALVVRFLSTRQRFWKFVFCCKFQPWLWGNNYFKRWNNLSESCVQYFLSVCWTNKNCRSLKMTFHVGRIIAYFHLHFNNRYDPYIRPYL